MKFKVFIVSVLFVCTLLSGISLGQNKVVLIPLMDECAECPDCNAIPTVTSSTGRVWMDRNLGADRVAQRIDDHQAYGKLYQWGRGTDGHEIRYSPTDDTRSITDDPVHDRFITYVSGDWRETAVPAAWTGVSAPFNPCPSGFRIPTSAEWQAELAYFAGGTSAGAFASPLRLPAAGGRQPQDGSAWGGGTDQRYWSSDESTEVGFGFNLACDASVCYNAYSYQKAWGLSVRCIMD